MAKRGSKVVVVSVCVRKSEVAANLLTQTDQRQQNPSIVAPIRINWLFTDQQLLLSGGD